MPQVVETLLSMVVEVIDERRRNIPVEDAMSLLTVETTSRHSF
jgi:hypothetical protein